ncbi:sodium:alanine symporter [Salmonella enterica subsp. enterica serovar Choleraesuis]|nr:sodium:alanine symporter [Salmonella enterica subsp. enterica serovar Choleraesuis]
MHNLLIFISELVWDSVIIYLLLGTGIWFTLTTRFVQFRTLTALWQALQTRIRSTSEGISPVQALCLSLAGRAGSGNLPGVALALIAGGPGALFWMWISGIIGMASAYAEGTLAQLFKTRDEQGMFRGGPAWYITWGLGLRGIGVVFAILLIVTFGLLYNSMQAQTIAISVAEKSTLPPTLIAMMVAALTGIMLLAGARGIARLCQWLVPLLALTWVGLSIWMVVSHASRLPEVFQLVINGAFGWQQAVAGVLSYSLNQALTNGLQRGMFINEAGLGVSPHAAGMALARPAHPVFQGLIQMIGVIIDSIILSSATAAIVLFSGIDLDVSNNISGEMLLRQAVESVPCPSTGGLVIIVLALSTWLSLLANYLYAESNLRFLVKQANPWVTGLKIVTIGVVMAGAITPLPTLWQVANLLVPVMALLNISAILLLSPVVRTLTSDYYRQRKLGITPVFVAHRHPQLAQILPPGVWVDNANDKTSR